MSLLLLAALAVAQDPEVQTYTWDVTVGGTPVGQRTLTVKRVPTDSGTRRILESMTELEGSVLGRSASFRQRMTAHATVGPASFHAAIEQDGHPLEVQARRDAMGWVVTLVTPRRERTEELAPTDIDLSTADLFDPDTRVPLWQYESVRLLRAEDGRVWTSPVRRLGPDEVTIDGEVVAVEGFALDPEFGHMELWYDATGVPVRFTWTWLLWTAEAVLTDPPPRAGDAFPVEEDGVVIESEDL